MKFGNLNSKWLEDFVYAYRHKNFSKAAEELISTPQSVSQNIRKLEAQLNGTKLFNSHSKGVEPTSEAHELYKLVGRSIAEITNALEIIQEFTSESNGSIRVGLCSYFTDLITSKFISQFARLYPNVTVDSCEKFFFEAIELLKSYEIDVMFFVRNSTIDADKEGMETVVLKELQHAFFVSKEFNDKHGLGGKITKQQLLELPVIGLSKGYWIIDYLKNAGIVLNTKYSSERTIMIATMVSEGVGIGYAVDWFIDNNSDEFVKLELVDVELPKLYFACAYDPKNNSKPTLAFIKELKSAFLPLA